MRAQHPAAVRRCWSSAAAAGFHCMRRLEKHLPPDAAELLLASSADYLLYSPLLPNVAAGVVEPRHIAVGLHTTLRRAKVLLGHVVAVDVQGHTATLRAPTGRARAGLGPAGPGPRRDHLHLQHPGVAEHGLGLKTLAEAAYLRDHVLRELDNADAADDPSRRRACCTFVVVGAGYWAPRPRPRCSWSPRGRPPSTRGCAPATSAGCWSTWPRVLPELGRRLGDEAMAVLRRRGVEVRLGTTVEANLDGVRLSDGETIRPTPWSGAPASPRAR